MYALLFFFCLTGQSGPSACGHVANNNIIIIIYTGMYALIVLLLAEKYIIYSYYRTSSVISAILSAPK